MAAPSADAPSGRSDRGWAVAAWLVAAVGPVVAIAYYRGAIPPNGYSVMSVSAVTLATLGVLRHRPKPLLPWLLFLAFGGLCSGGEVFRAVYATGLATHRDFLGVAVTLPTFGDLVPDFAEVAGYVCLVFAFARVLRARGGSYDGVSIDVGLVLLGAGALTGQVLLSPLTLQNTPVLDKLLAAAYPVLDVAALFLVLLVLFTIPRHTPASRFLFGLMATLFVGDLVIAIATTELTVLTATMASAIYIVCYGLFAAMALHPSMRDITTPQPRERRARMGPQRLVLVGIGLCVPTVYAILEPSGSFADRLVLSGACVALSGGVIARGWQAFAAKGRSDERLSALTKQANDLFIIADAPDFVVRYTATSATTALAQFAEQMKNRPLGEFLGQQVTEWLAVTGTGRGGPIEVHLRSDDQADRHLEVTWTHMQHDAFPGSVLLACRDITERTRAQEHARELNASLRAMLGRLSSVEADERQRVARELHDTVVQDLVAMRWSVAELASNSETSSSAGDLEALSLRLSALTDTARSVSFRLESPVSDTASLVYALRAEVVALRSPQLTIELDCGVEVPVTREIATLVFRTIREALRNVVQHARATHATVTLSDRDGRIEAIIRDDGIGLDPAALETQLQAGHIGVVSMRDSVVAADGTFTIDAIPSGGTEVRFTVAACAPTPSRARS